MTSPVSERQVAAYALVLLLDHQLIPKAKANEAVRALALDYSTMHDAFAEHERRGRRPPSHISLWPSAGLSVPDPPRRRSSNPGARAKQAHNMRDGTRGTERRCARCLGWFPATASYFGWKDQAQGWLRSYCLTCWSERQRETYLSEARRQVLEHVGVTFTVPEGADLAGVRCAKCQAPILAGQDVTGHVDLVHVACGDSDGTPHR